MSGMSHIAVRRANGGDTGAIGDLLLEVHRVHAALRPDLFRGNSRKYTPEQLAEIIAGDASPVFVATCGGGVVGHAFCKLERHAGDSNFVDHLCLYIDDICVAREARGRGVATALFEHVLNFARSLGCHNITLNVWEGNDAARRFYERMGFGVQKTGMELVL